MDDPVYKYLPNFEMQPRFANQNENFTLKRLLNHHSGIPGDDNLAFLTGLNNRSDSCVRFINKNNVERFIDGGYSGYDISKVPSISVGQTIKGNVDFHNTNWYKLEITNPGNAIAFNVNDSEFMLRLFPDSLADSLLCFLRQVRNFGFLKPGLGIWPFHHLQMLKETTL